MNKQLTLKNVNSLFDFQVLGLYTFRTFIKILFNVCF